MGQEVCIANQASQRDRDCKYVTRQFVYTASDAHKGTAKKHRTETNLFVGVRKLVQEWR